MRTLRLSWLLSRPGGSGAATAALPIVAFGVVTALLLVVLGGAKAFFSWTGGNAFIYQLFAVVALALLLVPLITLGGSAARLSARRRDDRLATLRLLGATPALVTRLTVLESTVFAVLGALLGVIAHLGLAPLVGLIPFRGESLGGAIWLAPWVVALVVVGVAILAAVSAIAGLRGVIVSPLGVRTKQSAPRVHWIRLVLAAAVLALTLLGMQLLRVEATAVFLAVVVGGGFGGTLAVLNVVGPWVIRLLARRQLRRATTAQRLLSARGILESPKAAWRQVSGVAMTSFMAVCAGAGAGVVNVMSAATQQRDPQVAMLATDVRTGLIITLVGSFLMVACSVGVNQAAAILDRRDLYVSLDRLGMPLALMDAARRRAVMSPLRIVAVGSAVIAAIVVLPVTGVAIVLAPASLLVIACCIAAGIGLVWLGLGATRPVLRRVLAEPDRVG
jgi:hypothetical protein